jgi:D-alanine-D-alanine ligase
MYKLVIFDTDGTLLDTLDDLADSMNYVLARRGYPQRSRAEVRSCLGVGAEWLVRQSLPQGYSEEELRDFLEEYRPYLKDHSAIKTRPYDGMVDVLRSLKAEGVKIAVVSSKPDESLQNIMPLYFGDMIDVCIGDRAGLRKKPAPDLLLAVMDELGAGADETLMVGDSEYDIDAAHNAKVDSCAVTWGFRDADVLRAKAPGCMVDNAAELLRVIKEGPMAKKRIAVVFGGKSSEHEVSRVSATSVIKALDRNKYDIVTVGVTKQGDWKLYEGPADLIASGEWEKTAQPLPFEKLKEIADFVLPIMHGPNAEDGTVQGLLELLNVPYGGCGVTGCAAAMDKIIAKDIFANHGLPQTPYVAFTGPRAKDPAVIEEIDAKLEYPVFIKPANMGSSVGITKVFHKEDLRAAIDEALRFDDRIVAEQGVKNARELETGIVGNDELFTASVGEIRPGAEFYDYEAKYTDNASELIIPAPISAEQKAEIQAMARIAYKALGCFGYARVDFLMDGMSGKIVINEINAIPGFTSLSMFPMLCADAGLPYSSALDRIIELGYERYNAKNNRQNGR